MIFMDIIEKKVQSRFPYQTNDVKMKKETKYPQSRALHALNAICLQREKKRQEEKKETEKDRE